MSSLDGFSAPARPADPRVTLGIATYNRDTYLEAAIRSGLEQDYESLEVLVVVDGSTNPRIDEILDRLADEPRLRVVRHPRNLGIAAGYNTFISEGRGELIAMLGDDDLCLPGRIRRQVEIFDQFPDTGVVHGDAIVIDERGRRTGRWKSLDFSPVQLIRSFFFSHNHLIDPTRMVHRRVYEQVGGYDDRFPLANDLDLWVRAAREFRFRHAGREPLTAVRRHGENTSDESSGRSAEETDLEQILELALRRYQLRELVPGLDWAILDPRDAERRALQVLAEGLEHRHVPLPDLARRLRAQADAVPSGPRPVPRAQAPRRLLITAYGWDDSGGGTTVPRLAAKELVRRGWEVTVFHAAVRLTEHQIPYDIRHWEEDGVKLIGIHNRPHGLFDIHDPLRELDDPPITEAFVRALDSFAPDVVHFHNLHNLGAALIDQAAARGVPAYFTTHNYWLICPRAYLLTGAGEICAGPGDGARCAACTGAAEPTAHRRRLSEIRTRAESGLTRILAVSDAVRNTLLGAGYSAEMIDVVRQAMPQEAEIWEQVGRDRTPGRVGERLTVAFLGSAYPHKGPQLLVEAAQRCEQPVSVRIHGEVPDAFAEQLLTLDRRGVVELHGAFSPSEIGGLLADVDAVALPSLWWDCAPLAASECRAARVPLLVPRLGGLPEAIADGVDGLSFEPGNPDDLAAKLDLLASEPGLLERLQAAVPPPAAFSDYVDQLEAYYLGDRPGLVGGPLAADQVSVRWKGEHGKSTSLSIINDQVSSRLPCPVAKVDPEGRPTGPAGPSAAAVEIRQQWPPDLSPAASGALAAIVPWEFGGIPEAWLEQINANVDELWVPSEHVRRMYVGDGIDPDRVRAIPNGVDLGLFRPAEAGEHPHGDRIRFLFVGGLIWRKGPGILIDAWQQAFADRDDVELIVKDFGADSVYARGNRGTIAEHADSGALPRVQLIQDDLSVEDLVELYRSADVLVHPYRGEGFAMPVLEAMACGLPVITTSGGPTDEFCPPEAGWQIRSRRIPFDSEELRRFHPASPCWVLEPDLDHLVALMREAAADPDGRRTRGLAARAAAEKLSWDAVAGLYSERITALAGGPRKLSSPPLEPFPFEEDVELRVLATPAWRGQDQLDRLLRTWTEATEAATSACLYLLADPAVAGSPEDVEAFVVAAAERGGVDLESCADINVLFEPTRVDRDRQLHASVEVYVPLHGGCEGHLRLARSAGNRTPAPDSPELRELLGGRVLSTEVTR